MRKVKGVFNIEEKRPKTQIKKEKGKTKKKRNNVRINEK